MGSYLTSDTLNSPQGDGNLLCFKLWSRFLDRQTPSIPRKGTETISGSMVTSQPKGQTPSIPRKGTETLYVPASVHSGWKVRHPQFPARGRKPEVTVVAYFGIVQSDTLNSPQGDGNHQRRSATLRSFQLSDTLNSPQGDGNTQPSTNHVA